MHVTHRKRFVSRDLVALAARRPQELAALSEAHYHDQIESIADEVLAAGQLRRVLFLATGALMSQTTFLQGESIPGIAHCVELGGAV